MKTIVSLQRSKTNISICEEGFNPDTELASAFNSFHKCCNIVDFKSEMLKLKDQLIYTQHFNIEQNEVERAFHKIKVNKSPRSENL